MFFILLILLSAFLIEGIGTYVSVVGLSALFAANPVIIVLAIALDLGKVVGVSFLYKHFKKINLAMKTYMTAAVCTLMMITSAGAFGYLSKEFQKAIQGTNQNTVMVQSLEDEQKRLQSRKQEIDTQIAKLPDNSIRGRRQLIQQFAPEQDKITARLGEIDKQLPELKIEAITKNTDVGPIIYIAQAFNTDPEHAVKWVIFIIIFVFDPLAISLLLAGNYLVEEREKKLKELPKYESDETQLTREDAERPITEEDLIKTWNAMDKAHGIPAPTNPLDITPKSPPPPLDTNPNWPDETPEDVAFRESLLPNGTNVYSNEDNKVHNGAKRIIEKPIDALDHITHEDLGRQKPVELPEIPHNQDPAPADPIPAPTTRAIPASKPREVITKEQISKPAKSQLEDSAIRDGAVDTGLGVKVR